jgi:AraC-like DNA-binding protein
LDARRPPGLDLETPAGPPAEFSSRPTVEVARSARATLGAGASRRDDELIGAGSGIPPSPIGRPSEPALRRRRERGAAAPSPARTTGKLGPGRAKPVAAAVGNNAEASSMRRPPRRSEVLQVLGAYIAALEKRRADGAAAGGKSIRRQLLDLVALALSRHRAAGERGSSAVVAARLAAALGEIAAQFQDPELGLASVARRQGISPRYLQRLLAVSGFSFTERVNELRLRRALTLLGETPPRRIALIALEAGFSDVSHFNRLFRSRFGDTPSGVRARGGPVA